MYFICIYIFFSLYTNRIAIYTFRFYLYNERGEGSERDLREWRPRFKRGEQKYMYTYNFLSLYTNTYVFYTFLFV